MNQPYHRSRRILAPVKIRFVYASILVAIFLSFVPTENFPGVPDFAALIVTFWCMREPYRISIGTGFWVGLVIDIAHGAALGQHAFAYVLLTYFATIMSRRLMWFSPFSQAAHMVPVFLVMQIVMLLIRLIAGGSFPGWEYFFIAFTTAALWVPAHYLLLLPQMQADEHDETRPI